MSTRKKIEIYDTTLRDGMQTIGVGLSIEERYSVVLLLAELGVDVIEVGFPSVSKIDYEITKKIANHFSYSGPVINFNTLNHQLGWWSQLCYAGKVVN